MPEVYYDLTPGELFRMYRMYNIRQTKEWERARFIAWYGTLPYRKKNDSSTPYDVMKLDTDPTEEDLARMREEEAEEAKRIIEMYKSKGLV